MNYIKSYKIFEKELVHIAHPVEIRFDVYDTAHQDQDSRLRHGEDREITEKDLIDMIEKGIDYITIALMHNKFDIGDPFILRRKGFDGVTLNIVCNLIPGKDNFTLVIITSMRENRFRIGRYQYWINVDTGVDGVGQIRQKEMKVVGKIDLNKIR